MRIYLLVGVLCVVTFIAAPAHAGIVNGDFEAGLTGWQINPATVPSTRAKNEVVVLNSSHVGHIFYWPSTPALGVPPVFYPSLSQQFDVTGPGILRIDLAWYLRPNEIAEAGLRIFVTRNGVALSSFSYTVAQEGPGPVDAYGDSVRPMSELALAVPSGGPVLLNIELHSTFKFSAGSSGSGVAEIWADNVRYELVPEPSTLALGLLGFAAVGLAARRRSHQSHAKKAQ